MADEMESVESFRARARAWITENLEPKSPDASARTRAEDKVLQAKLFDAGFSGFAFPKEYGGLGLTLEHHVAFFQEAAGYVTPQQYGVSIGMLAPTLLDCGSETLKQRHIPRLLRGDDDFIQLLSEPSGGSDMAGALTRAVRDGETYVINGSKMWSSGALHATHGMLLARTDWDVPKHRGLSMLLLPLRDYPGVQIDPIREVNGDLEHAHFCQEFFDDVVLPVENLIGEENEGWTVAQRLLFHERNATVGLSFGLGLMGGGNASSIRASKKANAARDLFEVAARRGAASDPAVRQLIGEAYVDIAASDFAKTRVMAGQRTGKLVGQWGSLLKLGEGMHSPAFSELSMAVAAADGVIWTDEEPGGGQALAWLSSRGISIAGGSNEMQRNIISERLLGLPREYDPSRELPFGEIQRRRSDSRK